MARDKKKKSQATDRRRPIKKKTSILSSESIDWVDYKDVNLLRRFMSERAKIRARRVTGNNAQQQRAVARAIRIAREMALLPYSVRQVTQRSRGGRRDRDRDRMPEPPPEREAAAAGDGGAGAPVEGGNGAEAVPEVVPDASVPAPPDAEDQS
jgi:small subunit ribosomal protein S18